MRIKLSETYYAFIRIIGINQKNQEIMKKYNYFYNGEPIPKSQFLNAVPENWESEVVYGEYSYGYYRAIEREQ